MKPVRQVSSHLGGPGSVWAGCRGWSMYLGEKDENDHDKNNQDVVILILEYLIKNTEKKN